MKIKFTLEQLQRIEDCKWLTDREREVFDLYYRRGWEIEAVAAEIYTSRSTVKRILESIRDKQKCLN